jgi:hypothetical protein
VTTADKLWHQMNITGRYSSTSFQTTNYGLGGTCDTHMDPFGYIEGIEISENQVPKLLNFSIVVVHAKAKLV